MESEVTVNKHLVDIATRISELQDIVQNFIDYNKDENNHRINDYTEEIINFQDYLGEFRGLAG